MSQQALERIQKLCLAYMDAEETQLDEEANSDAMWEVVKQVAEIATVELAAMENKGPLDYMSIETMKARIAALEAENEKLRKQANEPHGPSPGWSGDDTESYHQGFRGHGY